MKSGLGFFELIAMKAEKSNYDSVGEKITIACSRELSYDGEADKIGKTIVFHDPVSRAFAEGEMLHTIHLKEAHIFHNSYTRHLQQQNCHSWYEVGIDEAVILSPLDILYNLSHPHLKAGKESQHIDQVPCFGKRSSRVQ